VRRDSKHQNVGDYEHKDPLRILSVNGPDSVLLGDVWTSSTGDVHPHSDDDEDDD